MQQKRPIGVTILALWALVASGFTFLSAAESYLFFYYFGRPDSPPSAPPIDLNLLSNISAAGGIVRTAFGSSIIGIVSYSYSDAPGVAVFNVTVPLTIPLGVLYALIGLLTFRASSRVAWLANVGVSLLAAIVLPISFFNFYTSTQDNMDFVETYGVQAYFAWWSVWYLAYSASLGIRLYYLFRPSVRKFCGTESLFAQKQSA